MKGMLKVLKSSTYEYTARRFISWHELKGVFEGIEDGAKYIAIPAKLLGKYALILVKVGKEKMLISKNAEPIGYRRFPDKFGRDTYYTLAYFKWEKK